MKAEKRCPECFQVKPASEFYVRLKAGREQLDAYCKPCTKQKSVAWQAAHPERFLEIKRRWAKKSRERDVQARFEGAFKKAFAILGIDSTTVRWEVVPSG
jgi:hypothetical protein